MEAPTTKYNYRKKDEPTAMEAPTTKYNYRKKDEPTATGKFERIKNTNSSTNIFTESAGGALPPKDKPAVLANTIQDFSEKLKILAFNPLFLLRLKTLLPRYKVTIPGT